MTAPLQPAPEQPAEQPALSPAEQTLLAALAAYVAGTVVAGGAVTAAALLAMLLRLGIRRRAAIVTLQLALSVGRVLPPIAAPAPERVAATRVATDEPMWRARYLYNAARRLERALADPGTLTPAEATPDRPAGEPRTPDEAVARALEAERRFLDQHRAAAANRALVADEVDRAAAEYGPLLGWHAVLDARTSEDCKAMHGRNFWAAYPPAIGLPGSVHPSCRCSAGPPHRTGRVVNGPRLVALAADGDEGAARILELARYVRTPAGVARYKQPIGSLITNKGRRSRAMKPGEISRRALDRRRTQERKAGMAVARLGQWGKQEQAKALATVSQSNLYALRREAERKGRGVNPTAPVGRESRNVLAAVNREIARRDTERIRTAPDEVLEQRMRRSLERNRLSEFDRYAAEIERRDSTRAKAREQRQAKADAAERAKAAEYERLLSAGVDEREAVAEAYGVSVEKQKRQAALDYLHRNSYLGSFQKAARAAYEADLQHAYIAAEDATNGHMLTREAEGKGIDPASLFKGGEARARKYASPELREWWDENGRPSFEEFTAGLLDDPQSAGRIRAARGDFLA